MSSGRDYTGKPIEYDVGSKARYVPRREFIYRGVWAKLHPWSSTTGRPVPSPEWQREEYERVMGREPPSGSLPQFDYNPRTKAGRELLREMKSDAES